MIKLGGVSIPQMSPDVQAEILDSFDLVNWNPFPERGILSTPPGWLQFPTYKPPKPRVGEVIWPADPHAWATAYFVVSQETLTEIQAKISQQESTGFTEVEGQFALGTSLTTNVQINAFLKLIIDDGSNTETGATPVADRRFICWMKIAYTHRVSNDHFLLALVDERYYWNQNRATFDDPATELYFTPGYDTGTNTTFLPASAIQAYASKVVIDAIPSSYGYMNASLWNQWDDERYSWLAFYLNFAAMYGGRWVCTPRVEAYPAVQTEWATKLQMFRSTTAYADDNANFTTFVTSLGYGEKAEPLTVFSGWRYVRFSRYAADGLALRGDGGTGGPEKRYQLSDLTAVTGLPTTYTGQAWAGGPVVSLVLPVCAERGISSGDWNARTLQAAKDHVGWLIPFPDATFNGVANYPLIGTAQSLVFSVHGGMVPIQTRVNRYENGFPKWYTDNPPDLETRLIRVVEPAFDADVPLHSAETCKIVTALANASPIAAPFYDWVEEVKVMPTATPLNSTSDSAGDQITRSGMHKNYTTTARRVGTTGAGIPVFSHDQQPFIPFLAGYQTVDVLSDDLADFDPVISEDFTVDSGDSAYYMGPEYWLPLYYDYTSTNVFEEYVWKMFFQIAMRFACGASDNINIIVYCGVQVASGGSIATPTGSDYLTKGVPVANVNHSMAVFSTTFVSTTTATVQSDSGVAFGTVRMVTGDATFATVPQAISGGSPTAVGVNVATWDICKLNYFDVRPNPYNATSDTRPSSGEAVDIGVRFRPWIYIGVTTLPAGVLGGTTLGTAGGSVDFEGIRVNLWGLRGDGTHHEYIPR